MGKNSSLNNRDRYALFSQTLQDDIDRTLNYCLPHAQFAALRLYSRHGKKYDEGGDRADQLHDKSLRDFIEVNELCGLRGTIFETTKPTWLDDARLFIIRTLERVAYEEFGSVQDCLDIGFLTRHWRFGPGSSVKCNGFTHTADKIFSSVSITDTCKPLASVLLKSDPYYAMKLRRQESPWIEVKGSNMTTVPKNEQTRRTICTEPLGNMACQLAAGRYIQEALSYIGLDLTTQQDRDYEFANQRLAHNASIGGHLATIDLKSASDLISLELIKALWPPKWYELMLMCRSSNTSMKIDGVDIGITLNMMSTMGNGFTFPMMTLTLLAIVHSVVPRGYHRSRMAVFGDDIICESAYYDKVVVALTEAGLSVNTDKSFSHGPFRESCGGDFCMGYEITPFYVKTLSSDADIFVAINQVTEWSSLHQCPLVETLRCLIEMLNGPPLFVPEWEQPTSGILRASVKRCYYRLTPVMKHRGRRCSNRPETMYLILGQYIRSSGDAHHYVYVPRSEDVKYAVERVRLPQGYRTGWDPNKRGPSESKYIDALLSAM